MYKLKVSAWLRLCSFIRPLHLSPSLCLHMFDSARLSRPVNLSAISEDAALCSLLALSLPFLSFFAPLFKVQRAHAHTQTLSLTSNCTQTQSVNKLILSHSVSRTYSRCLALSSPHTRTDCANSTLLHKAWCSNVLTRTRGHKRRSVCRTRRACM